MATKLKTVKIDEDNKAYLDGKMIGEVVREDKTLIKVKRKGKRSTVPSDALYKVLRKR